VGIKLDMAKAYDCIEWCFLEETLTTMGFPIRLIQTSMGCVSTVSFSILVNGNPSPSFRPQRGIRQGDPLSPYLFILCFDVLSSLITKLQDNNKIKGLSIATNAPNITHLFFVDDSILFCRARPDEATHLLEATYFLLMTVYCFVDDIIFLPFERDLIKKLPITQEPLEDQLVWSHTTDGVYLVKSGYNTLNH
jgi:hypothetical protein